MQNPRVFIAFMGGGTALVMTEQDSRLIHHTGAVPVEYVQVEYLPRGGDGQVGGSSECFQGMRRRLDISDWCRDYSDIRCWKTYRGQQFRSRDAV